MMDLASDEIPKRAAEQVKLKVKSFVDLAPTCRCYTSLNGERT